MEQRKAVAVRFTNWTGEDFTHKWDSVEYTFKAGQTEMLQDYLAYHFAKHLAQREINRRNLPMSDLKFKEFYDKCINGETVSAETKLKLEMEIAKLNEGRDDKKEAMKTRMAKARAAKKKPEDNFEGNETA